LNHFIDQFLLYLATERGLSVNYQLSVRHSLESFFDWLVRHAGVTRLDQIEPLQFTDYLAWRKRSGLAAASIKLEAVALRIFFRFLLARRILPSNPGENLSVPRVEKYLPETLNVPGISRLLESVNATDPLGLRDRAMFELLYASGLRVSELCNVRLEALDLEEGIIRVTGKGNKTRLVPVGSQARQAMSRYLEIARPKLVSRRSGAEIFLSSRGRKLTPQRIWQLIKRYATRAGLEANVYPHLMRHSFATHLLAGGADLRIIQELLGHADISTTQTYTHVDSSHLKAVHKRFHPRA
jgi:integrase/recombinase XerD